MRPAAIRFGGGPDVAVGCGLLPPTDPATLGFRTRLSAVLPFPADVREAPNRDWGLGLGIEAFERLQSLTLVLQSRGFRIGELRTG
jgi:hypothetical protein